MCLHHVSMCVTGPVMESSSRHCENRRCNNGRRPSSLAESSPALQRGHMARGHTHKQVGPSLLHLHLLPSIPPFVSLPTILPSYLLAHSVNPPLSPTVISPPFSHPEQAITGQGTQGAKAGMESWEETGKYSGYLSFLFSLHIFYLLLSPPLFFPLRSICSFCVAVMTA